MSCVIGEILPEGVESSDGPAGWMNGWTIFYWGWWIAWSPFVGEKILFLFLLLLLLLLFLLSLLLLLVVYYNIECVDHFVLGVVGTIIAFRL